MPRKKGGPSEGKGFDMRPDRLVPLPRLEGGPGLAGPTPTTFAPGPDPRRKPVADLNAARQRIRAEEAQRLRLQETLDVGALPDPEVLAEGAQPPAPETPPVAEGEEKPRKQRIGVSKSLVRDIARGFLQDPDYLESLASRLNQGKAPHMEVLFHHYAYGKPATEVAIAGMSKPKRYDLDKLPPDKLQQVLAVLREVEVSDAEEPETKPDAAAADA